MKKSVRFASEVIHIPSDMLQSCIYEDSIRWYHQLELEKFKNNACVLITKVKKRNIEIATKHHANDSDEIPEEECCTRGLEFNIDKERKKRKYYAKRIILEAQRTTKGYELALLSSNLTSWAKENAINDVKDIISDVPSPD